MTLVSAVARAFEPGCKVDTMLVLEGKQGVGKTRFTRELFGADWYAEATASPGDKDFFQVLQGRWVMEIGEMESFTKAEVGKIKQAVTAQQDTFRASYGRFVKTYPRQCVFVGTTNENQYLRDPTGARRFLPIRVNTIDVDRIIRERDQLWAEAVHLYREGFDYWTLPADAAREQERRYQADTWEETITDCVWWWRRASPRPMIWPSRRSWRWSALRRARNASWRETSISVGQRCSSMAPHGLAPPCWLRKEARSRPRGAGYGMSSPRQ